MKASWFCFLALVLCNAQQFSIPGDPPSAPLVLRVDEQGRAFLAAGGQLLRLDSELNLEQNVTLPASAISISLGAGGRRLVVCTEDASCAVYNTNDLADVSLVRSSVLAAQVGTVSSAGLFTAGNTFYAANHDSTFSSSGGAIGRIRLIQVDGLEGPSNFMRSTDYNVLSPESFERIFFGGFVSDSNAYFIATDLQNSRDFNGMRVMRVCDGNCSGTATCPFSALYEESIFCGNPSLSDSDDGVCGLSVVEDFAGTQGTSILVSRCHPGFPNDNLVCLVPVTEIDRVMGTRFSRCQSDSTEREELFWRIRIFCSSVQPVRETVPNMQSVFFFCLLVDQHV